MSHAKLDLRRVPQAHRRAFGWILRPAKRLQDDLNAFLERPAASFARMQRELEAALVRDLSDGGPEGFLRRMFEPLAAKSPEGWGEAATRLRHDVARRRQRVARLPSGEPLQGLIDAVHAKVRNGPLLVKLDPERHGKATLAAMGRVQRTRGKRGEIRAEAILDAIAFTWKATYQPYLQSIWKLLEVLQGRVPVSAPTGDGLMLKLEKTLGGTLPLLVEPMALRIRNAVAHRRVEHLLAQGAVTLCNKDGWAASFRTRDLELLMYQMLEVSTHTFVDAMNAFFLEAVMAPLLPALPGLAGAVVSGDPAELERAGALFKVQEDAIRSDVEKFCAGKHANAAP